MAQQARPAHSTAGISLRPRTIPTSITMISTGAPETVTTLSMAGMATTGVTTGEPVTG